MMGHGAQTGRWIGIALLTMGALMAGACRRESFDDAWQRQSSKADQTASTMEQDMQARLHIAEEAGQGVASSAMDTASAAP